MTLIVLSSVSSKFLLFHFVLVKDISYIANTLKLCFSKVHSTSTNNTGNHMVAILSGIGQFRQKTPGKTWNLRNFEKNLEFLRTLTSSVVKFLFN